MSCSVYCLVSDIDQLDSLMESLECAGVSRQRVTVVWRGLPAAGQPGSPADFLLPWYLPFTPAAWWWWSATGPGRKDAATPGAEAAGDTATRVVVPYATLKARRLRGHDA